MSSRDSDCPSCGRFVGPYETCPYCGASVGQRMSVRGFKYGSLVLAAAGVAVLLLVAARSQVPTVQVGHLIGTMNWAFVRIEGLVTRQPSYDREDGGLQFWLSDGTGEIMVLAYRPEAEVLLAENLVPAMGDRLALEGTLRVKEDFQYLVLQVPQHAEVQRIEPVEMAIGDLDSGDQYRKVRVRGVIRDDRVPYQGLRVLALRDATGEIDVTLSSVGQAPGSDLPDLSVGQAVQVTGAVDLYRDAVQLSLGRASDMILLEESIAIAPPRRLGDISSSDVGGLVLAEGTIARVSPFSAGIRLELDDGSGRMAVVLWDNLYTSLTGGDSPAKGSLIRVQGEVAQYRGELEIVPELPSDLAVLVAATPPVTEGQLDQHPSDGEGQATVEVSLTSTPTPMPTATSVATPEVDITPSPAPTSTPEPTSRPASSPTTAIEPTLETRAIGSITPGDVGTWFTVERAGISDMAYFSKGIKYRLADGTGSITLLIWQNVLEENSDRYDLVPGSQVRVVGAIDEYEGELEIVPGTDADVSVVTLGERLPVEQRSVHDITPSDEGRIFSVEGVVARTESRNWLRVWIDDGTGQILIFAPERVVEYLPPGIGLGVKLQVTGEVDIYQGVLEIIPRAGADVRLR